MVFRIYTATSVWPVAVIVQALAIVIVASNVVITVDDIVTMSELITDVVIFTVAVIVTVLPILSLSLSLSLSQSLSLQLSILLVFSELKALTVSLSLSPLLSFFLKQSLIMSLSNWHCRNPNNCVWVYLAVPPEGEGEGAAAGGEGTRSWRIYRITAGSAPADCKVFYISGPSVMTLELEFLNKMPNPSILESQDLRWGGIRRYFTCAPKIFKNSFLPVLYYIYTLEVA